jgi:hypothetical protein
MTDTTANAVPAGYSAHEVSQGGHDGVMDTSSMLPASLSTAAENGFVSHITMDERVGMNTQSSNDVPAGASANEHSQGLTASSNFASCLLASFVKFYNASISLHHCYYNPRSSVDVRYSYYDRSTSADYLFGADTPAFLLCPPQTVRHEILPSRYANGMWRFVQKKYSYHSTGKFERHFEMEDDDKTYIIGGIGTSYDHHRYRKQEFVMNDGTKKMYAFREHPGKTKKMLSEYSKTEEGLNALLSTNAKHNAVWLDTSLPKTNEFVTDASLEFKQCYIRKEGVQRMDAAYMLFVKIVRTKNGQQLDVNYYPLKVTLTDFSTKGAVPPLFESETAELVREFRGELKKELAEKVFHPMRVFKMMETYGEDWDEKV